MGTHVEWTIKNKKNQYDLEGDIAQGNVDEFCIALQRIPCGSYLYMGELIIEDGFSMASIVSTLRKIRPVVLIEAPQMLAHTLYKTHMLSTGITLIRPREDDDFQDSVSIPRQEDVQGLHERKKP